MSTVLVVPCHDEAARLDDAAFERFAASHRDVGLLFVDDGSRDRTGERLEALAKILPDARVLTLPHNRGKAEAVRAGMLEALAGPARFVGYWDADLATPLAAALELRALLEADAGLLAVYAARVQMFGREIERSALRHYAGRVYATLASRALRLPIYDTQCGAKLFRAVEPVREVFAEPFLTTWTFDVEILARLLRARATRGEQGLAGAVVEHPLQVWRDVPGSKVRPIDGLRALRELYLIRRRYF